MVRTIAGQTVPEYDVVECVGGNVGPVGSGQEKHQLSLITGGTANTATELLLGPLARGATVHVAPDTGGQR